MNQDLSIKSLLREAAKVLAPTCESAMLEAELLLCFALNETRAHLKTWPEKSVGHPQHAAFNTLVQRRAAGEPIAYIIGAQEFWSMRLIVNKHTLIPRPETELLVEQALTLISNESALAVADLGTGSGAIALALAKERPMSRIVATDASSQALQVARKNAQALNITNIEFRAGSWFDALPERYHVIVSNPPYIASQDPHLAQGDLRFEPSTALSAGSDGLQDLRAIVEKAGNHLHENGWLLLEHGWDQAEQVRNLLRAHGFDRIDTRKDLANIERVTLGRMSA